MLKLTFGIIVLNGDFFLKQVLESIYPHAYKICIAEGAVKYWQDQGINSSYDDTIEIIKSFPDPGNKIILHQGQYSEKDDQCRAWFQYVPTDTDYVFTCDSDEIHYENNYEKLIRFIEKESPTSVGFKSDSFFGGFDHIMGGFERDHSFKRLLKYLPGCSYFTHRSPTLAINGNPIQGKDISGNQLYQETGITFWHGSYNSPDGVFNKIRYYHDSVGKGNIIDNYFETIWLPWVRGDQNTRNQIENEFNGIHEFKPSYRGECRTLPFTGQHPEVIQRDLKDLKAKFNEQLEFYL
jgi:hypothetical protein